MVFWNTSTNWWSLIVVKEGIDETHFKYLWTSKISLRLNSNHTKHWNASVVGIQYYTREHKAEYPRFDKHSNIELSKLRDKLFIPVIFVIEQKIVKFLEFQTNISFPFHTRLIHTDCDSSSHNESTVVHDKTDVEYGDQSTVMKHINKLVEFNCRKGRNWWNTLQIPLNKQNKSAIKLKPY
jgi:hypothetical protein